MTSAPTSSDLSLTGIDPELISALAVLGPIGGEVRLDDLDLIHALRDTNAMMAALGTRLATDARVHTGNMTIAGRTPGTELLVRLYRPAEADGGALLFFHGGAHVLGDVYVEEPRCLRLAAEGRCLVVSVDYALAPEEPFPADLEDALAALRWLAAEAETLGVDLSRIGVGGGSAGAGLAASLALAARDQGGPALCWQMLVYPMLDDRLDTPSMQMPTTPLFGRRAAQDAWAHYLAGSPATAFSAPARADDLSGLPPAYAMVAEHDVLRDEGIDYARRLVEAGVPTELHLYPGTVHGFDLVGATTAVGRRALVEQAAATCRALGPTG